MSDCRLLAIEEIMIAWSFWDQPADQGPGQSHTFPRSISAEEKASLPPAASTSLSSYSQIWEVH